MFNAVQVKEEFIRVFKKNITRKGSERLFKYLCGTDFFTAPASTRFHSSCEGGLMYHSLCVYKRLVQLNEIENTEFSADTLALCALLHDVCKVNFYTTELRNKKNEKGQWEQVPYYTVDDKFPFGHGEKSVYMLQNFVSLSREESLAIRWHMGGFDDTVKGGNSAVFGTACNTTPLLVLLSTADFHATYLDEVETEVN